METRPEPVSRSGSRPGACRFCGQAPTRCQHRVPGPRGPICAECVEAGLYLTMRGRTRPSDRAITVDRLARGDHERCEFCRRWCRGSFLGIHRKLCRVICPNTGAVICADCLDTGGELLNRAIHG